MTVICLRAYTLKSTRRSPDLINEDSPLFDHGKGSDLGASTIQAKGTDKGKIFLAIASNVNGESPRSRAAL